jgi:hypothetical protein
MIDVYDVRVINGPLSCQVCHPQGPVSTESSIPTVTQSIGQGIRRGGFGKVGELRG